ncbi:MAG: PEP/pyruvate-binding domain-containing protein, partial [Anaerolineales bacterium]
KTKAVQSQKREGLTDPVAQESEDTWQRRVAHIRDNLTDFYFAYNLPFEQFEKILKEVLSGRVPTEEVVLTIHPELAPWDMLFAQGEMYENSPPEKRESVAHHLKEIKVVLIKAMISDHLPYLAIAREWFDIADLKNIREHRIGRGKIGGKAAGVMLADTVLRKSADPELKPFLHVPPSWFLGADVFYQFSQVNGLLRFANQKYRTEEEIRTDYPAIESVFLDGQFPTEIVESLRSLLETVGSKPLIVRSSSLLEDSYGTSFAGKYESYFCANQGDPDQNLADLLNAVQKIYASVYNPDVLLYRRKVGLIDYDERMAILIQEVQGSKRGRYFMPDAAGVAFSRNEFRWSPRIDREAGFLRMVWGLGTRAVEQLGNDYPRLVALSHPSLRPEAAPRDILRYSQHEVDLIDLNENTFCTLPVKQALKAPNPNLRWIAQRHAQGSLEDLMRTPTAPDAEDLVITFESLLSRTTLPGRMRQLLHTLEQAYQGPVDTEFTIELKAVERGRPEPHIHLLQCRPQSHLQDMNVELPQDVPEERILFTSHRMVPTGKVSDIQYIVYVCPRPYNELATPAQKSQIARLIGRINQHLEGKCFILIGPGRWGSNNPDIGIPVGYGDIYQARALIEVAEDEQAPEPSYGTHFFQDLVEAHIFPLAVTAADDNSIFNRAFFEEARNKLAQMMPQESDWDTYVHLIEVQQEAPDQKLDLIMDGEAGEAIAYLIPTKQN